MCRADQYPPYRTPIEERLEYLRGQIRAESISYGEIAELQSLAPHISSDDVELLEWAGVPEHEDDPSLEDIMPAEMLAIDREVMGY